ncbi:3-keto-5-aminohexanoate cleavage protein [Streptomyces sp. NBC_00483]|uniref:3-keto-5-aminohexanoate cleavage protein n=1 Tax=Streptomyces sp. NBC_00483 TaxID=2975756 RepID=UPI002E172F86
MLQACLNGARSRAECSHLPVTPDELATAAREAVAAGAEDIHLHPKDRDGRDTLDAAAVAATVDSVRAAVPGVPVGVTTGAWATADPRARAAQVRAWTVLPDHASVNWHEDGATDVAAALLERGVGIEAGIYSGTGTAQPFLDWPQSHRVLRILAEITETTPQRAAHAAAGLLGELEPAAARILLQVTRQAYAFSGTPSSVPRRSRMVAAICRHSCAVRTPPLSTPGAGAATTPRPRPPLRPCPRPPCPRIPEAARQTAGGIFTSSQRGRPSCSAAGLGSSGDRGREGASRCVPGTRHRRAARVVRRTSVPRSAAPGACRRP